MRANEPNYYEVLQVSPGAEPEVIEAAYRRLARKYHPDVDKTAGADRRMQEINAAYEVLSDPQKRSEYDVRRQYSTRPYSSTYTSAPSAPSAPRRPPRPARSRNPRLMILGFAFFIVAAVLFAVWVRDKASGPDDPPNGGQPASTEGASAAPSASPLSAEDEFYRDSLEARRFTVLQRLDGDMTGDGQPDTLFVTVDEGCQAALRSASSCSSAGERLSSVSW